MVFDNQEYAFPVAVTNPHKISDDAGLLSYSYGDQEFEDGLTKLKSGCQLSLRLFV